MNLKYDSVANLLPKAKVIITLRDPYDLFITNTTTTMKEISVWSEKIFGINAVIDIDTMKFFINIWRSNNII